MALHYFIDGYNLLWSSERFGGGPLRSQRERLLQFLEDVRPGGSARNLVTVVFDGQEDVDSPTWKGSVQVVYSRGKDADAVIKRNVDNLANPRVAVVVTDDRDIRKWVRGTKAKVLSCAEFLKGGVKKSGPRAGNPRVDAADARDINAEMKDIWKIE